MRLTRKTIVLAIALLAIITTSVFGTIAYLTDTAEVTNTFTIGKVDITVDETVVDKDGVPVKDGNPVVDEKGNPKLDDDGNPLVADRTEEGNTYPMIPGESYVKDPTMTVKKDSQPAYYRMMVTLNCVDALTKSFKPDTFDLSDFVNGLDTDHWKAIDPVIDGDTITYEFRYTKEVAASETDVKLEPLFTKVKIPEFFDNEDLARLFSNDGNAENDFQIKVAGNAIQKTGFEKEDDAWVQFNTQIARNAVNKEANSEANQGGGEGTDPDPAPEGGEGTDPAPEG